MDIQRRFLTLPSGHQVHYRMAGVGPAMILMHPSPSSSEGLVRAMNVFAERFTCIALDTPGYGISDDSVADKTELWGFADVVAQVLDVFGLEDTVIYGAATGAQIGVQFARKYPQRTRLLVMDGAGHFSKEDLVQISDGYFVDLTPRRDGSHLLAAWDASRHLSVFFPWMSERLDQRIQASAAPPESVQHGVNDMLRAGPSYRDAYWQAFQVENNGNASQVTVPTVLAFNTTSIVRPHTEALIELGLPDNFTVVSLDPPTRYAKILEAAAPYTGSPPCPPPPPQTDKHPTLQNIIVEVPGGFLRARGCLEGEGRPLMAIHDPAGSSLLVEPILMPYLGRRPVIAFDNPGNGESDAMIETIASDTYATCLISALHNLGIEEVDVLGRYSGGPVAMEMSFQNPTLVKHIIQTGVSFYEGDKQAWLVENYTPSIAPRWDGRHLLTAWAVMRDQGLYWPWFNQTKDGILWNDGAIDVDLTHLRVVEMLKCGDRYQDAYNAMWTYPMREKLPQLKVPCLLSHPPWEPVAYTTQKALEVEPRCTAQELPPAMADWHRDIDAFLNAS